MLEILSLGAGVQSTTVLLMSLEGELPKLDAAVFADTGWEPRAVYDHLTWLEGYAAERGLQVHRVAAGNVKQDALVSQVRWHKRDGNRWASLPYFVLSPHGKQGMNRRQCTREYKLDPLARFERESILGLVPRQRGPAGAIRQWIGISLDEYQRAKPSREKWRVNWHPLIEKRITRRGCLDWLEKHGFPRPPRSACIGCPFKSDKEWRWLRDTSPEEFEDACQFDEAIRHCGGMRGQVFLHSARIPLRDVDLSTDRERGQLSLWQDECSGICGV